MLILYNTAHEILQPSFSHSTSVMLSRRIMLALLGAFAIGSSIPGPELTYAGNGSFSWAGSNLYFLHGLDADTQSLYIETLAGWGVKVLSL